MFGASAGWWSNVAAGGTMACNQQWPFVAGAQPTVISPGGVPMSAEPSVEPGIVLADQENSLPRLFRQPCGSSADVACGFADGTQRWASSPIWWTATAASGPASLPSPAAEFGIGGVGGAVYSPACCSAVGTQFASVPAQLPSLPNNGQLPLKESPYGLPSGYGHQSNMKRRYSPSNVDFDDGVPYKTRLTDEKMASRLQNLSLRQQSSGGVNAGAVIQSAAEERSCSTSRSAPTLWDEQGWQKFHEVEQRLAAIEEESPEVIFEHVEDCGRTSETKHIDGLRLELSPELQAHLTITELETAMQNSKPQQSLALVLWKAPDNGQPQRAAGATDGSSRPTVSEQDSVAIDKGDVDESEELPVELRKDADRAQTFAVVPASAVVGGSVLIPNSMDTLAESDDRLMDA